MVVPHKDITCHGGEPYERSKRVSLVQLVQKYQLQERQDQQPNEHCVTSHPWQTGDF